MIYKIVGSYFFLCLCIAIFLSINGVTSSTQLGIYFQSALVELNYRMSFFHFEIPRIPEIPLNWTYETNSIWDNIAVVRIAKIFTVMLNLIIKLLNGVTWILNLIVKLFEFVVAVFETLDVMSARIVHDSNTTTQIMYFMCSW